MELKKLFVLFAILFLTANAFATAPTLSEFTYSKAYAADHNYANWIDGFMTMTTLVTGADLNESDCWYALDGSWTKSENDMNTDTNIFSTGINVPGVTDDVNWCIRCGNTSGEYGQTCRTLYADDTAPETIAVSDYISVALTATDEATTTGNGSGVKRIYYKLDDANWTYSTSNPLTIAPAVGNHTLLWYAMDNLDNNEMQDNSGAPRSKSFYVGPVTNEACYLVDLIPLILAAILLVSIVMAMKMGIQIDAATMPVLVVGAVVVVIGIIVYSTITASFCALP